MTRRRYQPRACTTCGARYTPTGGRSQRCESCRVAHAVRGVLVGRTRADAREV